MRLRVRFPDGASHVVSAATTSWRYSALVKAISEESSRDDISGSRILRMNAPGTAADVLEAGPSDICVPAVRDGDTLRVEPVSGTASRNNTLRTRGRTRRTITSSIRTNPQRNGLEKAAFDFDDPRDKTYTPDADAEPPVQRRASKRSRPLGHILGDGSGPSVREARGKRKRVSETTHTLLPHDATSAMGVTLAAAASGAHGERMDSFRRALSTALGNRQREVAGERRFAAALARSVEFGEIGNGAAFTIRFRTRGERNWTEDGMHPVYGREHIVEGLREFVEMDGEEGEVQREKLRPAALAEISPRVFWNLYRLFPQGIENGLLELFPDTDWSFLKVRRRVLSAKAKANLRNRDYLFEEEE